MIAVRDIGVALDPPYAPAGLDVLARALDEAQRFGYRLVELPVLRTIIGGELHEAETTRLAAVLRGFDLRYSLHGAERLNLAYDPRHELAQAIMRAQIEVCRRIGARTLVYHSGLQALDDARRGVRLSLLNDEELAAGAAREVAALRALAPLAAAAGVTIAVENGDPHLWEYTVLDKFGAPRHALARHHARLQIGPIVRQLEAVDHPAVGLTLDIAHLHLAAHELGFDYLAAVTEAAPWVRHLHVNDNFGRLDRGVDNEMERWAFGEADIHLPPGWGSIPYAQVFARLPDYTGDLILEIKPGFYDLLGEALHSTRQFLAAAQGESLVP